MSWSLGVSFQRPCFLYSNSHKFKGDCRCMFQIKVVWEMKNQIIYWFSFCLSLFVCIKDLVSQTWFECLSYNLDTTCLSAIYQSMKAFIRFSLWLYGEILGLHKTILFLRVTGAGFVLDLWAASKAYLKGKDNSSWSYQTVNEICGTWFQ